MSYLAVGMACLLAGGVLDALYQQKVVSAARREADALRGILDSYRAHLSEMVSAIAGKIKL